MGKHILGVVVGLMVWFAAVVLARRPVAVVVARVRRASGEMSFTLPMKLTRLSIGALTTFAAGAVPLSSAGELDSDGTGALLAS